MISVVAFRRALLASLALHGVALALMPAFAVAPPAPQVLSVRLQEMPAVRPPKPELSPPPKPKPLAKPVPAQAELAAALVGGAALSDPEMEALPGAVPASATAPAVLQAAASASAVLPDRPASGVPSTSSDALASARERAVAHAPGPTRLQTVANANSATATPPRIGAASQSVSAEAVASVRGRGALPTANASSLQTAHGAGDALTVASAAPQSRGVTSTSAATALRRGVAEVSPAAHLGQSGVAGLVTKRSELARGGLSSADADAIPHAGPEVLSTGLLTVGAGGELGIDALANAPSGGVFRAAIGRDGRSCFKPPPTQWRAEGRVTLRVAVGRDGKPREVTIVESSGLAQLDELARSQAANCAQFVVQNRRGEPLAKTLRLPISYRNENAW